MKKAVVAVLASLFFFFSMPTRRASCGSDCGCINRKNCTMPCANCCGPEGMKDCFKHPDPSK